MDDQKHNKTLSYTSTTEKPDYGFCFSPNSTTIHIDLTWAYALTGFPQRTFSYDNKKLTNLTTNETLYLLATPNGIYTTFQVLGSADQQLIGVYVTANRTISGSTIQIGSGTTGSDGAVTFWVNPDFAHTFLFQLEGYDPLISVITPTQSQYTVYLAGAPSVSNTTDFTRSVSTPIIEPKEHGAGGGALMNDTTYEFNYTISSTFFTLDRFGFHLYGWDWQNGTLLGSVSSTSGTGGTTRLSRNTNGYDKIVMDYYYVVSGNYSNGTRVWMVTGGDYGHSIKNFFERVRMYANTGMFGLNNWSLNLIVFVMIFLIVGTLCSISGIYSPGIILWEVAILTFLFDVGAHWITSPVAKIPYFMTMIMFLLSIAYTIREATK